MNGNWLAYVGFFALAILAPVVTVLLFRRLGRVFPLSEECLALVGAMEELDRKYRKWDLFGGFIGIVFGVAGGYASWWVCRALCAWRAAGFEGAFVLIPQKGICLTPAVPAALCVGIAGAGALTKLLLGKRFREFACYGHLKIGFNASKFLAWMFAACAALTVAGVLLPMGTYMVAGDAGLTYNPFLGFSERTYRYEDIASIECVTYVRNRFKQDVYVKVHFNDGAVWNSANTQELPNDDASALADGLSRRAGVPVEDKKITRK